MIVGISHITAIDANTGTHWSKVLLCDISLFCNVQVPKCPV